MTQEQIIEMRTQNGSDLWVAVGVVVCLGLGAGATYWLTHGDPERNANASVPVKGVAMNRVISDTASVQKTDAASSPLATIPTAEGEYACLTFETLASYFYQIPDMDEPIATVVEQQKYKNQIPDPIKNLDGKRVGIMGFMVPVTQEQGSIKTFMLVRDQSVCCNGRVPRMNEWINVSMAGNKTTRLIRDQAVTVFGTLHVGEQIEKGVVLSVYRFDADDVAGPLDL